MSLAENFLFEFSQTTMKKNNSNLYVRSKQQDRREQCDENTGICEENDQLHFPCSRVAKGILRAEIQSIQFLFVRSAVI